MPKQSSCCFNRIQTLPSAIVRRLALPALLSLLAGQTLGQSDSMESVVRDFLHAGLAFQNHDAMPYMYLGEPDDVATAASSALTLEEAIDELRQIQRRLLALENADGPQEEKRRSSLNARLTATITRGEILLGMPPSDFQAEAKLVFGVEAPLYDEEHFTRLTAELDSLIPGDGPLVDRMGEFRDQFVIPPEKLELVIGRAMQECRARTMEHIELPANENVTLNIDRNMPYVGFTQYRGNSQSTVHLNADVPVHIERAIELGCHEGYPGHHVHASLVEQEIINNRGWDEYKLITLMGPYSVITEGAASYAEELAFSREERMQFNSEVLMPLAGLDASNLALYANYTDLVGKLNYARNTVASAYLYEGMGREEAIEWLMKYGLETRGTATQRLDFIDVQRAYVLTYNYGRQLVAEHIGDTLTEDPEQAWAEFVEILLTPLGPQDLLPNAQ